MAIFQMNQSVHKIGEPPSPQTCGMVIGQTANFVKVAWDDSVENHITADKLENWSKLSESEGRYQE